VKVGEWRQEQVWMGKHMDDHVSAPSIPTKYNGMNISKNVQNNRDVILRIFDIVQDS